MTRPRQDTGLSLIELTIAVSILGLVMAAVTTTLLVSLRATTEATDRLDRGNDLQFTSALFGPDVAGAADVTATRQPGFRSPRSVAGCGSTDDPLVVQFQGISPVDLQTNESWTVSYVTIDGGAAVARRACSGGSATPDSELVVSAGLATDTRPTVHCYAAGGASRACEDQAAVVVDLRLTGEDGDDRSATGTRRIS